MAAAVPLRTNFHPSKTHSDIERWICIYPAYINSKKTRQEGRRLPKELCVENPTFAEIRDVLVAGSMRVDVENKLYCREKSKEAINRGRIRVQMRNNDGTPLKPELDSREAIMRYVTVRIPQLKTRQNKGAEVSHAPQSSGSQAHHGGSAGGSGGGGGKKGKGKRR